MKSLLAVLPLLCVLLCVTVCEAQTAPAGYQWQCDGQTCRLVPVAPVQRPAVVRSAPIVMAATPATYRAFAVDAAPVRLASVDSESLVPELPAATAPVTVSSTCNCSETGGCVCDPATCRCASCATGQRALATAANAAVYAAPAATANVYSSPRGPVTLTKDGNGNALITHQGGPYGRRLARHLARGVRLGVQ